MSIEKKSKFSIEVKETMKGEYYLSSLKIDADSVEEMERLIELILPKVTHRIAKQNSEKTEVNKPENKVFLSANDRELYEYLRKARNDESRRLGIKPFMICSNKTLKYIATERPSNVEEMLQIYGMGEVKIEQYGTLFLQAIIAFEEVEEISGLE